MIPNNDFFKKYMELYNRFKEFEKNKLPLCAAENYLSDFVNNNISIWEGKYCLSLYDFQPQSDFIGAEYVNELLKLTIELCSKIFKCNYVNPKTLSGMNCFTTTALSCLDLCHNRNALVTSPDSGGHQSIPRILNLLGYNVDYIPYDYKEYDINYSETNKLIKNKSYSLIVFAQSDLIRQPNIDLLDITDNEIIIFDATQTLGLIAAELLPNPLQSKHKNTILIGGTHKTFPGPSCGLIMTNNLELSKKIDEYISPLCIRDFHPENTAKLLLSLIEFEQLGKYYQDKIVWTARTLACLLEEEGFNIAKFKNNYTETHQIFILTNSECMNRIYNKALKFGITLNKKNKPLFSNYGIRIGVQQIARYDWGIEELKNLAKIFYLLDDIKDNDMEIKELIKILITKKNPHFILL